MGVKKDMEPSLETLLKLQRRLADKNLSSVEEGGIDGIFLFHPLQLLHPPWSFVGGADSLRLSQAPKKAREPSLETLPQAPKKGSRIKAPKKA